jgi:hypothetical protein
MLQIPPNASNILEKILNGCTKSDVKTSIFKRFLKRLALGCIITFVLGFITSILLGPSFSAQDKVFITIPIFLIVGLITAKLSIDSFNKENKVSKMAFDVIDKTVNDLGNEFDTFTSKYLIDFISLETQVFDNELVTIKDSNNTQPYSEIRSNILKKYRPMRRPAIPYRTQEYSDYMSLLQHIFRDSKFSHTPYREVLNTHFNKKDRS